jgi:tetratricopeptide (TPR) repeat protein
MNEDQIASLIVRAFMNFSYGRFAEAKHNFEEILLLDPDNLGAQVELINFLYMDGYLEEAFVAAKGMIDKCRDCSEGYFIYGLLLFHEGELEKAAEYFGQAASTLDVDPIEKLFIEMFQFLCEGRYEEMLLRIQELRNFEIDHPFFLLFPALVKIAWEREQSAMIDINELIDKHPYLDAVYQLRGQIKFQLGDWKGAEQDFSKALELDQVREKNINNLLLQRGTCRMSLRDPLNAIEDLSESLKRDEFNGYALYLKANAHLMLGIADEAMRDIDKAIHQCDYRNSQSLTLRGQLFFGMDNTDAAKSDLTEALTLDPHNGIAHSLTGLVLLQCGKIEDAIKELELGYSFEPNHAITQVGISLVELSRKNEVKARIHFEKANELGFGMEEITFNEMISNLSGFVFQNSDITGNDVEENVFKKKGDMWEVRYKKGDLMIAKNLRGMTYISQVLRSPNTGIPCECLMKSATETISTDKVEDAELRNEVGSSKYYLEHYSVKDLIRLRELSAEKEKALKEDAPDRSIIVEECENEIESIMQKIKKTKQPDTNMSAKNRNWAISKAIKETIKYLYNIDAALARHLENTISTGAVICYKSQNEISWSL